MASLKEFETALLNLGVVIDEIRYKGKDVRRATGKRGNSSYYWLADGACYSRCGTRTPSLDLKLT